MARGLFRKTSFNKMVGAYRSQWKRFWLWLFTFGTYGRRGMGWLRDPKKAWYNFWYNRTSVSIPRLLGYRPSWVTFFFAAVVATVISIAASPVDAARAGAEAHRQRARKKEEESKTRQKEAAPKSDVKKQEKTEKATKTVKFTEESAVSSQTAPKGSGLDKEGRACASPRTEKSGRAEKRTSSAKEVPLFSYRGTPDGYIKKGGSPEIPQNDTAKRTDEITPLSRPRQEKDQYIRKRMVIAGSSYCDPDVLSRLTVGTYIDLAAEPTNPHDKDAVMLMLDGKKVGYISKQDRLAFATCLRLGRRIYGVITAVNTEGSQTEYEYEAWIDSKK